MSPNENAIAKTCPICWEPFMATGGQAKNRIYCSVECKRTAAARREVERAPAPRSPFEPAAPAAVPAVAAAPVQLPQLAAQRDCPHCGRPVTIVALLTTPEAARPQMPAAAPAGVIPIRR